jgi:hypothetical protein
MNGSYVLGLVRKLGDYAPGPCPAIVRKLDGQMLCGIVLNPNKYIKAKKYPEAVKQKYFAFLIGAGSGCDALLDDDTEEEETKLSEILEQKQNDPEWRKKIQTGLKVIHGT